MPGQDVIGEWSWYENPFVGSVEYGGLVVANLILNNWDWKTSNNKVLGILKWFRLRGFGQGTRNDLEGFERQGFIRRVDGDEAEFDYSGIYRDVIETVTPAHVRWACARMSRLTDAQWADAFRAGGYTPEEASRYVAHIKAKLRQGMALTAR